MATIIALIIAMITFFILRRICGNGAIELLLVILIISYGVYMLAKFLLKMYVF